MRVVILTLSTFGLLASAGCGKQEIYLPGETPIYTISCDAGLDDCHTGAKTLCNGAYETVNEDLSGSESRPGNFGWVDKSGEQHDLGGSGGKYSIRIRCGRQ